MLNELLYTPPKFDIAPEIDGWKTILSFWDGKNFQGLCCASGGYIFCLQEDPN